ncbi:MAG: ATP synthase F1 subunit delta [Kiritimatiellae bacterium]|nr:ATP synthase F1 subunit delta [Kiritimatiellia bacterium]
MKRSPVAIRYARAIFELAREQGQLEAVQTDFAGLSELRKDRETFYSIISPYVLTPDKRAQLWKAVFGDRTNPLTMRFLLFLASKGRGMILGDVIHAFNELCWEAQGIVPVEIVSAHKLSDDQLNAIVVRFEQQLEKKLRATVHVDPSLLGGFQVRVQDTIYDYSVNHQLDRLQRSMTTA